MNNKERKLRALTALRCAEYDDIEEDLEFAISDLISDLLHLHTDGGMNLTIEQLFARAKNNFETEVAEEIELPDEEKLNFAETDFDVTFLKGLLTEAHITNETKKDKIIDFINTTYKAASQFDVIVAAHKIIYS